MDEGLWVGSIAWRLSFALANGLADHPVDSAISVNHDQLARIGQEQGVRSLPIGRRGRVCPHIGPLAVGNLHLWQGVSGLAMVMDSHVRNPGW